MIPFGPAGSPGRVRFSWKVFGLVLLVVVALIAGLVIVRLATGWPGS